MCMWLKKESNTPRHTIYSNVPPPPPLSLSLVLCVCVCTITMAQYVRCRVLRGQRGYSEHQLFHTQGDRGLAVGEQLKVRHEGF